MSEEQIASNQPKNQEAPPKWLQDFRSRISLFDVAYKAFDPNISDAEIRKELKEAAKQMEGIQLPGTGSSI